MGYSIQQNQTSYPLLFLLVQSSDHITPLTGASPTVTLSKNGGSFASPSGTVSEIGSGWYKVAANATDTNTLGPLKLHATATSGDPTDEDFFVVAFNPADSTRLGLTALPNANAAASGGLPTVGTGSGQINVDGAGNASANIVNIKGTASVGAAGYVGIDWGHVNAPTTAVSLSSTTISTSQTVASVSGSVASVTGNVGGNVVGSVASVTGSVGSVTGNVGGNVVGSVGSVIASVVLPSIPSNWITSSGIAANALNGKGDWLLSSGYTAPNNSGIASIVAKLPTNNIADETLVIAATNSILSAVGSPLQASNYTTPPTATQNADALLGRNINGGSSSGRIVSQALAVLRNKVSISASNVQTVYSTDDVTVLWSANLAPASGAVPFTTVAPTS